MRVRRRQRLTYDRHQALGWTWPDMPSARSGSSCHAQTPTSSKNALTLVLTPSHPPSLNLSLNRSLGPFARRNLPAVLCSLTFHLGIKRLIKFHYKWVGQHIYTHTHTHTITRSPTHAQLYVCIFKWGSKKVISLPYDHMAIICDFGLRYSYAHILTVMPGRDELISCQYR